MRIRKAGIIVKRDLPRARELAEELSTWFSGKGITTSVDQVSPGLDILVILGGDGSLLHIAAEACRNNVPVMGINLGSLGFLTEVAVAERFEALESLIDGSLTVENRTMLQVELRREGKAPAAETPRYALNDVVISKNENDQLVQLSAWVDREYITTYRADGLIFSTPTGSTAYNLSAGGPIVHPCLPCILVTPICPFMLESRPILLPTASRLLCRVAEPVRNVRVIVDGRVAWNMEDGDLLEIKTAAKPLKLVCSPRKGYFEILRNKLNWGGRTTSLPFPDR